MDSDLARPLKFINVLDSIVVLGNGMRIRSEFSTWAMPTRHWVGRGVEEGPSASASRLFNRVSPKVKFWGAQQMPVCWKIGAI
jgi:hypothetical protein